MFLSQPDFVFGIFQVIGTIIGAGSAILIWRKRSTPGAIPLLLGVITSFIWEASLLFETLGSNILVHYTLLKIETICMAAVSVFFLIFTLEYTHQNHLLNRKNIIILWIIPWIITILAITNDKHLLIWNGLTYSPETGEIVTSSAILMNFFIGYYYLIRTISTFLLIWTGLRYPEIYRSQFFTLLACGLAPWLGNFIYFNLGWLGFVESIQLHAFGYILSGTIFGWGIMRYGLFDIIPLARDFIIETLDDGIIVTDSTGQIIDANQIAHQMLAPGREILRLKFENLFREVSGTDYHLIADSHTENSLGVQPRRHLEITTHSIKDNRKNTRGMLITLHDITHQMQVQQDLQAERDFAMLVMNNMGQGLTVTDSHKNFEYVNPAYARMIGYRPEELIGRSPQEFTINKIDLENAFARRMKGEITTYQSHLRTKDGGEVFAHITGVPHIRNGKIIGTIAVITDLTENQKADEELQRSRAQLSAIFENAGTGIWVMNLEQRFVFVNAYWAGLLVHPASEIIGQSESNFLHPYDIIVSTSMFDGLLHNEYDNYEIEKRYRRKDGSYFWGALSARPIYDTHGEIESVVGFVADITQRKQAEEALRESERRFRDILENVSLIAVMLDRNAIITFCNEHFLNLTDWRPNEVIGKNWMGTFEPGEPSALEQFVRAIQRGSVLKHHENTINTHRGEKLLVSWSNITLRDENSRITGIASIGEDITARRRAERSEREQREFAEALSDTAAVMNTKLDLNNTLKEILHNVERVVPHDAANIALIKKQEVHFVRARGYENVGSSDATLQMLQIPIRKLPNIKKVIKNKEPSLIPDTDDDPTWIKLDNSLWIRSHIATPIIVDDHVIGILNLDSGKPNFFNETHAQRLKAFSVQAAIAFKNAQLYEKSQRELVERKRAQSNLRRANRRLQLQLEEIAALQTQLREQAIRDPLTELFNRRYMEETLAREISRAERDQLPLGILMMDIDHFKKINDTYGHDAGDLMLKALGKLVSIETRRSDIACRFGGEEFCLILPGASRQIAYQRAEILRNKFANITLQYEGQNIQATLSIGISELPEHGTNGIELVKAADQALYRAKNNGRNRTEIAGPPGF